MKKKQKKEKLTYVTVEKLENGFLLIAPEKTGSTNSKWYKGTMNGVVQFLQDSFGVEKIQIENKGEITETNISDIEKTINDTPEKKKYGRNKKDK